MSLIDWFKKPQETVAEPDYDDPSSFLEPSATKTVSDQNRSVCASCSGTKKSLNQDYFCQVYVEEVNANVMAVADGVGSSFKAEVGSKYVCEKAVELAVGALRESSIHVDFISIFKTVQEELDAYIEREFADDLTNLEEGSFASTLIVGIDFPDRFVAAYVGNGSILHIGGNFAKFPDFMCLPWNAVNLLNPHTICVQGKETLYKFFFYKGQPKHYQPSIVEVRKNKEMPGDIFVITTDGVYSSDHEIAVKDDEGDFWMPLPKQLGLLYDSLKQFAMSNDEHDEDNLHQTLVSYLEGLKDGNVMDDDTTLGVVFSSIAVDFIKKQQIIATEA